MWIMWITPFTHPEILFHINIMILAYLRAKQVLLRTMVLKGSLLHEFSTPYPQRFPQWIWLLIAIC